MLSREQLRRSRCSSFSLERQRSKYEVRGRSIASFSLGSELSSKKNKARAHTGGKRQRTCSALSIRGCELVNKSLQSKLFYSFNDIKHHHDEQLQLHIELRIHISRRFFMLHFLSIEFVCLYDTGNVSNVPKFLQTNTPIYNSTKIPKTTF